MKPDENPAVASPDRAEELARDKFAELRTFLTNMRRDAADAEDPELSEYAQAIEQRLDEIAALLRSRMEEREPSVRDLARSIVKHLGTKPQNMQAGFMEIVAIARTDSGGDPLPSAPDTEKKA